MPGRFYGRRSNRSRGLGQVIKSNKNIVSNFTAGAAGATVTIDIAKSVDSAALANVTEVNRGSKIFRIWLEFWVWASETDVVGITNGIDMYIWKNPGNNLTPPTPGTEGSSNEKKFIFKKWKGLIGARTEGSPAYTWKGWIKVPRVYQRQGADDQIELVFGATGTPALVCSTTIYKYYE